MSISVFEEDIRKLEERLRELKSQLKKVRDEQDDMEQLVIAANRKKGEIDEGIQRSLDQIRKRADRISGQTLFKERYLKQAEKILKGEQTNNALMLLDEGIRKSQRRSMELDADIYSIKQEIYSIEQQIGDLRVRAAEAEETAGDVS